MPRRARTLMGMTLLVTALAGCLDAPPFRAFGDTGTGCNGNGVCDLDERNSTCAQDCTLTNVGASQGDSCSPYNAACNNDQTCAEWLFCEINPTACQAPLPDACYNNLDAAQTCGGIDACITQLPDDNTKALFCAAIRCYARQQL